MLDFTFMTNFYIFRLVYQVEKKNGRIQIQPLLLELRLEVFYLVSFRCLFVVVVFVVDEAKWEVAEPEVVPILHHKGALLHQKDMEVQVIFQINNFKFGNFWVVFGINLENFRDFGKIYPIRGRIHTNHLGRIFRNFDSLPLCGFLYSKAKIMCCIFNF